MKINSLFISSIIMASITLPALSLTAQARNVSMTDMTAINQLKPIDSGPGVVVTEPISNDKSLIDFGAGCARWLHLNVSPNAAFEKTPEWEALALTVKISTKRNLRLNPEEAKILFKRFAVSRVVTSTIAKNTNGIIFEWQIWQLPELKLIGEVKKETPTRDDMVKALPQIGQDLVTKLGGDVAFYKKNQIAPTLNADELAFIGSLPWAPSYDTSPENVTQMEKLSGKSLLAIMFYLSYLTNIQAPIFTENTLNRWKITMRQLQDIAFASATNNKPERVNFMAKEYLGWINVNNKGYNDYKSYGSGSEIEKNYLHALTEANYKKSDYLNMLKKTEQAVRANINSAQAWYNLSKVYIRIAQFKRYNRPMSALTDNDKAYLNRVYIEELAAAQKCIELDSSNGYYWLNLAGAATFAGKWELAEKAMDKSLLLIPDKAFVYIWAIEMYQAKWHSNPDKFMAAWEQCFQHPAALAVAFPYMIIIRQQFGGKSDVLIKLAQRAVAILQPYAQTHPNNIKVLYTLGDIGIAIGQPKIATPALEKLKKLLPNDQDIDKMLHKAKTMPTWVGRY